MARIGGFKDLIAWQKGMDLVETVYQLTGMFPPDERFGLSAQLRRAAVSVPCNVAEGYSRPTRADYVRFLGLARGSLNEVETQLLMAVRLRFVPQRQADGALHLTEELQRILRGLISGLQRSGKAGVGLQQSGTSSPVPSDLRPTTYDPRLPTSDLRPLRKSDEKTNRPHPPQDQRDRN